MAQKRVPVSYTRTMVVGTAILAAVALNLERKGLWIQNANNSINIYVSDSPTVTINDGLCLQPKAVVSYNINDVFVVTPKYIVAPAAGFVRIEEVI
jgi:hypothetical protein